MQRLLRPFWFFLAVLFLIEAWLWHHAVRLGHGLVRLVPYEAFKRAVQRFIDVLPPWATLIVFVVPIAVVEPLKLVAVYFLTHGYLVLGILGFIALKIVAFALIAFMFELCRDKLLEMRWFVKLYQWFVAAERWAHGLLDPFKVRIKTGLAQTRARLAPLLARLRGYFGGGSGAFATHIRAVRLWWRRKSPAG